MADELRGADAFIEQLIAGGVRYVFGNPGTTEEPFLGRLHRYSELRFVTTLHESVAVCAAEGYARASGSVGVVELHAGPGLGNGLGMLYNAAEGRTPLLVYVGQVEQSARYLEPTLGGDLVAMAHPLAKWAHEVLTAEEIPQIVRRALKVATTPPCGPVVLSVPMDLMEQPCAAAIAPALRIHTGVRPDPNAISEAADVIARADAPVILVGDGVARAGAIDDVDELARLLGAPVYGAFMTETCIDPDSPLNAGRLPSIEGSAAARALRPYDCVIAVGTKVLSQIFPVPGLPLGERDVVHVGLDTWELAKNQPSTVVFGDERESVHELTAALAPRLASRRDEIDARRSIAEQSIAAALIARQGGRSGPVVRAADVAGAGDRRDRRLPSPGRLRDRRVDHAPTPPSPATCASSADAGSVCAAEASAPGCRSHSACSSPIQTAPSSPSSATARRCTRSRRCGPPLTSG